MDNQTSTEKVCERKKHTQMWTDRATAREISHFNGHLYGLGRARWQPDCPITKNSPEDTSQTIYVCALLFQSKRQMYLSSVILAAADWILVIAGWSSGSMKLLNLINESSFISPFLFIHRYDSNVCFYCILTCYPRTPSLKAGILTPRTQVAICNYFFITITVIQFRHQFSMLSKSHKAAKSTIKVHACTVKKREVFPSNKNIS